MDDFVEEKVIGSGNYGTVVVVRHRPTGVLYCLKKIDWSQKTEAQQNDSINEVKVMAQLSHPNIIILYRSFVQKNILHILMEYADATDFEKYLIDKVKRGSVVSEGTIMKVFVQIAIGLRHLHRQHMIHRDLKSANVFLSRSGRVKLGDFGFSKQLNYSMGLTSTVCGTPYYFSPEICQKKKYCNKIDIWSLGVILYESINLRKPFEGKNLHELRKRVVNENPAPFTAIHVSREVKDLCLLLLCKNSAMRPSIEEVLRIPIVQVYMKSLYDILIKQCEGLRKRAQDIMNKYSRKDGEEVKPVEFLAPLQRGNATTVKQKFDKETVAKVIKGFNVDLSITKEGLLIDPSLVDKIYEIHTTYQPNFRTTVSNDCPINVITELHNILSEEDNCAMMKNSIDEILNSDIDNNNTTTNNNNNNNTATVNNNNINNNNNTDESTVTNPDEDLIGDAESDEEKMLREALGENFIKGIKLAIILSEVPIGSSEAESVLQDLKSLLGDKSYLLPDLQMLAIQFELEA